MTKQQITCNSFPQISPNIKYELSSSFAVGCLIGRAVMVILEKYPDKARLFVQFLSTQHEERHAPPAIVVHVKCSSSKCWDFCDLVAALGLCQPLCIVGGVLTSNYLGTFILWGPQLWIGKRLSCLTSQININSYFRVSYLLVLFLHFYLLMPDCKLIKFWGTTHHIIVDHINSHRGK